jgi:hypothetical protein
MIDSTVNHPAPAHDTEWATSSLGADVRAALRNRQTLFNLAWPVATYLIGYVTGLALQAAHHEERPRLGAATPGQGLGPPPSPRRARDP